MEQWSLVKAAGSQLLVAGEALGMEEPWGWWEEGFLVEVEGDRLSCDGEWAMGQVSRPVSWPEWPLGGSRHGPPFSCGLPLA